MFVNDATIGSVSQFNLISNYQPTGDQPTAIAQLVDGLERGEREQTLLGVTGSGKTFTMDIGFFFGTLD